MANKQKHLVKEERFMIGRCLDAGDSYRDIAKRLQRGVSTISEEISNNGGRYAYDPEKAGQRAYLKQYRKKRDCLVVALNPFLALFVEDRLRAHWSPERIAGHLKKHTKHPASAKAIRKFACSRSLESFLYRRGKIKKTASTQGVAWLHDRVFIDDPRCVRDGYGHWEGDFIVSSKSSVVLLVLVERITKETLIRRLPNRQNVPVREALVDAFKGTLVKSLTLDNDIAFVQHKALADALRAPVYFARPYRSTDKALVENTNRWIRWFVPKRMDIATVTDEKVRAIEEWFNTVPRQCLDFSTSREMVVLEILKANGCSY